MGPWQDLLPSLERQRAPEIQDLEDAHLKLQSLEDTEALRETVISDNSEIFLFKKKRARKEEKLLFVSPPFPLNSLKSQLQTV